MLNNERQQQILSCMEIKNTITVKELTDQLYASPSTIRRDLSELEAQGFLKRIHGGAVLTAGSTFDTPASLRRTQQLAEKQRIADLASRFLAPSATYFFDSSSTAAILATRLTMYPDVKVATNGVAILANMKSTEHLSILSTGGFLRSPWDELTGNLALKAIENLNADIFFFSCAGFTAKQGASELSDENVSVKRRILLCDSTKIDKQFFFRSFSISEIDYIITDRCPDDPDYVALLGEKLIF